MKLAIATCFALLCGPALSECPANPDIGDDIGALIEDVQAARTEGEARIPSARMWEFWTRAPDGHAQDLLDEGMERRGAFDLDGATAAFDELVAYCPEFAEGYNQRAFANFIRGDYAAALPDLDRAIELRPRHIPAIAGRGLTLIQLGRIREGQTAIREALTYNPWLSERQYLAMEPEDVEL